MWWNGPWSRTSGVVYGPVVAVALVLWSGFRIWSRRKRFTPVEAEPGRTGIASRAA
jgi:hypothetical protein